MPSNQPVSRRPVYFCYANPSGFSGQKEATDMIIRGLTERGWDCRRLPQPYFERGGRGEALRYTAALLLAWFRASRMFLAPGGSLCVNLGQTLFAFLRDGVPLAFGRVLYGQKRVTISLHGSPFMHWERNSWTMRLFLMLLRQAGTVTVLGVRQRARLIDLGIGAENVRVVVNSCALAALSDTELADKLDRSEGAQRVTRLLHLGSLYVAKGFPEYLDALRDLSLRDGPPVEAVLCGRLVPGEFAGRFRAEFSTEKWIEKQIETINRSRRVKVRWVRGAVGVEKESLFRAADLFVLPTRYAVEAQPIVLLEAMASACAIVTTSVGEIPTILDETTARFLPDHPALTLAETLEQLIAHPDAARALARAAHRRFVESYELSRHLDDWEKRLAPGCPNPAEAPVATEAV